MTVTGRAAWRSPALGPMRELRVSHGIVRSYEAGSGEPVVFVHGMLTNANVWRKLVERLAPAMRCITLDLPMGGHLAPLPGADLSPSGIAETVVEALDALGLERATIAGNDSGNAVSQIVAVRHPERVERLILTSGDFRENSPAKLFRWVPVLGMAPGLAYFYLLPGYIRPLQRMPIAYGWLAKHRGDPQAVDTYFLPTLKSRAIRDDYKRFALGYRNKHAIAAARELHRFERPTLIAWSREDKLFPGRDGIELSQLLPDARLRWIDDSYGLSPDDNPEQLADAVLDFMQARRPALAEAI
jgi:pimeloyl-ACP methyl ester carboxylesterase